MSDRGPPRPHAVDYDSRINRLEMRVNELQSEFNGMKQDLQSRDRILTKLRTELDAMKSGHR